MRHIGKAALATAAAALLAALFATAAATEEATAPSAGHEMHETVKRDGQNIAGMSMGGCPMMRGGEQRMGGGMMMGRAMMGEPDFKRLKTELKITDAQTQVWDAYVTAATARGDTMKKTRETHMKSMKSGGVIQRLDAHIAAMQGMLDALKELKPSTAALYDALTDEQKKTADQVLSSGSCMMM